MRNEEDQDTTNGGRSTEPLRRISPHSRVNAPFGRSLGDFLDQDTESRLLPAEDQLLAAAAEGKPCDLTSYSTFLQSMTELDSAVSNPDMMKLCAEVIASSKRILRRQDEQKEDELEARVNAQPRVLREFLRELPGFADSHAKSPKDLRARVKAEPGLLEPILKELKRRFRGELMRWRQVDPADPTVLVRAAFLRFLALGGDEAAPVHEKGVHLQGACIDGEFDLTACADVLPLQCTDCVFLMPVNIPGAHLRRLSLSGCRVPGIDGVRCKTEGSVFLDRGFLSSGSVRLIGAVIGGTLDCSAGTFNAGINCSNSSIRGDVQFSSGFNSKGTVSLDASKIGGDLSCFNAIFNNRTADGKGTALRCNRTKIDGDVDLTSGFLAEGEVSLYGAEIGGDLNCHHAAICNRTADGEGRALGCANTKIAGEVYVGSGFVAEGEVSFSGAEIGGSFWGRGGVFENLVPSESATKMYSTPSAPMAANALDLSLTKITKALVLGPSYSDPASGARIKGVLDLEGAVVQVLVDHPDCWPKQKVKGQDGRLLTCAINLNGFIYDRFAHIAPAQASDVFGMKGRLDWLLRQPPQHVGTSFRPQPFEQLIKVLRNVGHESDAQQIAVAKQRIRRRIRWTTLWQDLLARPPRWRGWALKPFEIIAMLVVASGLFFQWLVLDLFLGGGYAKLRPALLFLVILLGCAWFYGHAAEQRAFVPTNPAIYNNLEVRKACAGTSELPDITTPIDWYRCVVAPAELNRFRPLVYSLDQMIPFIQLGQKRDWQPIAEVVQIEVLGVGSIELAAWFTQAVTWIQTIGSMLLYLLIAAILGGLIKRE